ncbi:TPA: hypothetical protein ACT5CV_000242 [Burkholderia cenocepacia]
MKRIAIEIGVLAVACAVAAGAGYAYRGAAPAAESVPTPHTDSVSVAQNNTYGGLDDMRDTPTTYYLIPDALVKDGYRMGTRADTDAYRANMNEDLKRPDNRKAMQTAGPGPDVSKLQGGINPRTGPDRAIRMLAVANDTYMRQHLDKAAATLNTPEAKVPANMVPMLQEALRDAEATCKHQAEDYRTFTNWANSFSRDPAVTGYTKGVTDAEYLYCVEEARKRGLIISDVVPSGI